MVSVSTGGTLVVWDSELRPTQKPVAVTNELNTPLILSAAATGTQVAACRWVALSLGWWAGGGYRHTGGDGSVDMVTTEAV